MRSRLILCLFIALLCPVLANGEKMGIWRIQAMSGELLTEICEEPYVGDEYISTNNQLYEITEVMGSTATAVHRGTIELPALDWLDAESAVPVSAMKKRIALYCTHSDESYEPSDGYYSTRERGSIYQVANTLAENLTEKGIDAQVADTLHHPHDAGAYRRSRQTAVQLLRASVPDCLIDVHRDGIPDPASYAVTIGGEDVSKIRLLVGRGNQNAAVNKEFALTIKAVADRVYPGLIKDIYMGKGAFNQDLLPKSILFECGTYTLEKEKVMKSMPLMADVLDRALYGGITGSAGRVTSDVNNAPNTTGGITMGEPDTDLSADSRGMGKGFGFLGSLFLVGIVGFAILSAGSFKGGMRKASRSIHEMTGGLVGKKPGDHENHEHS